MKALYKCRVCGRVQAIPTFELDDYDSKTLKKDGGWIPAANSVKLKYQETIITKCDLDHYGVMDFVGFEAEQEDEQC